MGLFLRNKGTFLSGFQSLILDHDGTISETKPLHEAARRQVLQERLGESITHDFYRQHMMSRGPDTQFVGFGDRIPVAEHALLFDKCQAVYKGLVQDGHSLQSVSGIDSLIVRAVFGGLQVAIATTQPEPIVQQCIEMTLSPQSRGYIQFVETVHGKVGKRNKPAPDVYLDTCARLGVEPSMCIAIEDSPNGVKSAVAAGIGEVIGRANAFCSREELREAGAHMVFDNYSVIEFA